MTPTIETHRTGKRAISSNSGMCCSSAEEIRYATAQTALGSVGRALRQRCARDPAGQRCRHPGG